MAERVVLHVGAMKSGTSFIQGVLGQNRDHLAADGVLFPGEKWRAQVTAVRELIGRGGPDQPPLEPDGPWQRLVEEIDRWPGTAVISMEFLGPRSLPKIEQVAKAFPGASVEAVVTVRDLARTIPAMWLESVQNRGTTDWADYLTAVKAQDGSPVSRRFWRHQAVPEVAKRWTTGLGEGRVTLVTVPPSGAAPGVLWGRFASVVGVDPDGYDLSVRANPSIGLTSALVLLRLNRRLAQEDGGVPPFYDEFVKHRLAKRVLVRRAGDEPRLGLDAGWVTKRGQTMIERIVAGGHALVGDLADLSPRPVPGSHAKDVDVEAQLDAAVDALAGTLARWAGPRSSAAGATTTDPAAAIDRDQEEP